MEFGTEFGNNERRFLDCLAVEEAGSETWNALGFGKLSFIASSTFALNSLAPEWELAGREVPMPGISTSASVSGMSSSSVNLMLRRTLSISESLKPLSYMPITSSKLGPSSTEVALQLLRA